VSISVGFYHTLAVNEIEANPFFIKADKALYLAKKLGRNTIVNYHNMDN
jgi:PleD family two-component response regulator